MKYNVYRKYIDFNYISAYIKIKVDGSYEYSWIRIKSLNDEDWNKASLNIFEAKQVIDDNKAIHKLYNSEDGVEYWVEQIQD